MNTAGQVEPLSLDVVTDGPVRQLRVRFGWARLIFALRQCPPIVAALEVAAVIRWVWDLPPDECISAILATLP